jgi:mannan endo-1,4-beta-mannosidase
MSKKSLFSIAFAVLGGFAILTGCTKKQSQLPQTPKEWPIIVRKGDMLYEGDKPFRFMSFATPNIQQNESQLIPDMSNRFPDEYEVRDILSQLQRIGGRATRTFSLSVFSPEDNLPVYIQGKRDYNEEAFKCLDRILAYANEYDVRIIVPFIASQKFYGIRGVDEFAALSGKTQTGAFWTDPEVKDDFKHFLNFILNRVNTISGIAYKDDPSVLAWQFGNEFGSYYGDRGLPGKVWSPIILEWCNEMAVYIKSIDPNHLLIEAGGVDRQAMIDNPNIDVISDHLYEYWSGMGTQLSPIAKHAMEQCRGKKPLMITEFGLGTTENLRELMKTIREEGIVGGLMWSIRGHRRDGGWYYHNEGGTLVNSFHVPGFAVGRNYEEQRVLDLVRKEAYLIRGEEVPPVMLPAPAPVLMQKGDGFTWRGATGAAHYVIERAESETGQWTVLATGLHDAVVEDVKTFEPSAAASEPLILYYDELKENDRTYFYRIKGVNSAGESDYSNVLRIN